MRTYYKELVRWSLGGKHSQVFETFERLRISEDQFERNKSGVITLEELDELCFKNGFVDTMYYTKEVNGKVIRCYLVEV